VRYALNFGTAWAGKSPYFLAFVRAETWAALPQPTIYEYEDGQYYFDFDLSTLPAGSSLAFSATIAGSSIELWDQVWLYGPYYPTVRTVMGFGSANAGMTPSVLYYSDLLTGVNLTQPTVYSGSAGLYYFDSTWSLYPSSTQTVQYSVQVAGIQFSNTQNRPPSQPAATTGGISTLSSLRTAIRQQSDTENDPHIQDSELNAWINASYLELYGLLVTAYGEDYFSAQASITTDGVNQNFPLPDGNLYNGAPRFFKGMLAEIIQGPSVTPYAPVTLRPFNLHEKNRYNLPGYAFSVGPFLYPRYRLNGSTIMFTPVPQGGLVVRLWYAPALSPLVYDTDVANDLNGWLELVIVDGCIKAMGKQERDAGLFVARKNALIQRIREEAANRNLADPNTVTETDPVTPFGSPAGPWGGGGYW